MKVLCLKRISQDKGSQHSPDVDHALFGALFPPPIDYRLQDLLLRREANVAVQGGVAVPEADPSWAQRVVDTVRPYLMAALAAVKTAGSGPRLAACKRDLQQCLLTTAVRREKGGKDRRGSSPGSRHFGCAKLEDIFLLVLYALVGVC